MRNYLSKYFNLPFKKRIFFLCFLFLSGMQGYAQDRAAPNIRVHAAIDTQQIKIGEQLHLTLQAVTDSGVSGFNWAVVPDTFNHLMVVARSPLDTFKDKGHVIYQKRYTLTGFDSGQWYIPSFQFHAVNQKDTAGTAFLHTDSIPLYVHTVPVDTTKPFQPIKEIRSVPFNLMDYWPYLLGGLVLLLIVLFFVFVYKKKTKPKTEKRIPEVPPYDQAVKELQILENEKLWEKGKVKAYYSRLTDIVRWYIQRQYHINAMEQTSDELLEKIRPITILNQRHKDLQYILQTADLAKFAKLLPQPEEHENCMRKARDFIEWTKPRPQKEENKEK